MWIFESAVGLPGGDARVVVPNGRAKLIIPWRNGLTAHGAGQLQDYGEGQGVLIGLWDAPTVISSAPVPTVSIGVEFTSSGFSRFFSAPASELTQRIEGLGNALGAQGDRLLRRVMEAETKEAAARLVATFLCERFESTGRGETRITDEALRLMAASGYRMDMRDLERRMGYSARYLAALFQRDIGFAPKRLSSILAFERLYRAFSQHRSVDLLRDDALDIFYDQSHFIRHFKQFTGESPTRFAEANNEFGRIFYRSGQERDGSVLSNTA